LGSLAGTVLGDFLQEQQIGVMIGRQIWLFFAKTQRSTPCQSWNG